MKKRQNSAKQQIFALYKGLRGGDLDVSYTTLRDIEMLENSGRLQVNQVYMVDFMGDDAKIRLKGFDLPIYYGVFDYFILQNGQYVDYNEKAKAICENTSYFQDGEIYY